MNLLDIVPIALVVVYGALGFLTGIVRRLIGVAALYLSFFAANNMGLQAGSLLQQSSNLETPDARIYGFFGIVLAVIIVVEGAAQLAHSQIQIEAIVLDKALGLLVGLGTGLMLAVVLTYELQAAANPLGGGQLDQLQQRIRDTVSGSHIAVPLVKQIGKPIVSVFQPVLPAEPQIYFSSSPVN